MRLLQTALNQFSQTLPINGVFDSTTWNQLYLFRSRNGLGGDTVADAAVWNKLQQDQYFYIENREVTGITGQGDYKFKFCWIVTDGSYAPEPIYTGNKAFFMHRSDGTWCLNSRGTLGSSPEYVVK